MELDPLDRVEAVPDGHDLAVVGRRAHLELLRQRFSLNRERMVAPGRDGIRKPLEDRAAIVSDQARLPVEDPSRVADLRAVRRPDTLMAETNPERRRRRAHLLEDVSAHTEVPRVSRMAWPGREDDRIGYKVPHLFQRDSVVAVDKRIRAEFADLLVQVVHE